MNKGSTYDIRQHQSSYYYGSSGDWDDYYPHGSGYGDPYYSNDFNSRKNKKRHEFSPVLLIYTTCYDCKHCKRKKEDCTSEYCDDENSPPDWDIRDW